MNEEDIVRLIDQEISSNFSKKIGDTPTEALQLVNKKYADTKVSNVVTTKGDLIVGSILSGVARLGVGADATVLTSDSTQPLGIAWEAVTASGAGLWGDGSDGTGTFDGSATPAGTSKSGSTYTLLRDVYYTSATLSASSIINTVSFRIFCTGTVTIGSGSKIHNNGNAGAVGDSPGSAGTPRNGGIGGTAIATGTMPGALGGANGGAGGNGTSTANGGHPGVDGSNAVGTSPSWGVSGPVSSFKGGDGGVAAAFSAPVGGNPGTQATVTAAIGNPRNAIAIFNMMTLEPTITQILGSASSQGAGGGGGGQCENSSATSGAGGGGGGSGGSAGYVVIFAKIIVNNNTSGIQAKGGAAGNGGAGHDGVTGGAQAGGGGGGQGGFGGQGGIVLVVTTSLTGSGTIDVTGGIAGTGGAAGVGIGGGGTGNVGLAGVAGMTGVSVTMTV